MSYYILFVYLAAMAWLDLCKKRISLAVSAVAVILLIGLRFGARCSTEISRFTSFEGGTDELVTGVLIGIFLIAVSWLTRGQIGMGDGVVFIISGVVLGGYYNTILLLAALMLTAVAGVIIMIVCNKTRRCRLPFVPFVCAGYGVMCICMKFT